MSKQFVSRVSLMVLLFLATLSHVALASSSATLASAAPTAQDDGPTGTDPEPPGTPSVIQVILTILSIA
jgi:hypothetical protein